MKDPAVIAAVIGALALVFATLIKLIFDLRKVGHDAERVSRQVHPNGGTSMKDIVVEIQRDVKSLAAMDSDHGQRIVKLETIIEERDRRDAADHKST